MRRIIPSLTAIQIGTLRNLRIDILLEQISLDFLGSRALTEEEEGITNVIHSLVPLMFDALLRPRNEDQRRDLK